MAGQGADDGQMRRGWAVRTGGIRAVSAAENGMRLECGHRPGLKPGPAPRVLTRWPQAKAWGQADGVAAERRQASQI